jgi:hypothetical protein
VTAEYQQYGILAQVRDDGDLFLVTKVSGATLGKAEAREFFAWFVEVMNGWVKEDIEKLATIMAAERVANPLRFVEVADILAPYEEAIRQDQAEADAANDQAYNDGTAPVIETVVEVAPSNLLGEIFTPPPVRGAGSSAEAWRAYAAKVTDSPVSDWSELSREEVIALLKEDKGVLDAEQR